MCSYIEMYVNNNYYYYLYTVKLLPNISMFFSCHNCEFVLLPSTKLLLRHFDFTSCISEFLSTQNC